MENVKINTDFIKLDQFLKWAGITSSGVESKILILENCVKVNGEIENRRGKKIRKGDIVEVNNSTISVT